MSTTRIHPLTGEAKGRKPINGHPRPELATYFQSNRRQTKAKLSYDAVRPGNDLDQHFAFADALDADSAHNRGVRLKFMQRSRYEQGSNGIYDGSILKHVNRICGATGPQLRMLTGNRNFNQLVEREFYKWAQRVKFRRKLWAMTRAKVGDGETFAILQTNPAVNVSEVQLDFQPIEAEQVQSAFGAMDERNVDGIRYDAFNNIIAYEILPFHPGGLNFSLTGDPITVDASLVLHWFKLKRPGAHRGVPDYASSLGVGATGRRHREATVAAVETAADIAALIHSRLSPAGDSEPDPVAPYTTVDSEKRQIMTLPMGWEATQMKAEHPIATYEGFTRANHAELGCPVAQPVNVTGGDSSNYSFASGKLDTLFYREAIDVERADCNELILDPLFAAWFREWTTVESRRDIPPLHQWDWPRHPVIDDVADASATQTNLQTGRKTMRQVCSDDGSDYEDQLAIQAEDTFGEATPETIAKCRQINVLKNTPKHAIDYVAQLMGLEPANASKQPEEPNAPAQAV